MAIIRSAGIPVIINNVCHGFAGGGYEGKTDKLDKQVQLAAKLLIEAFGGDVQIRFNSHRLSGGAWLVDGPQNDYNNNNNVGICVTIVHSDEHTYFTKLNYKVGSLVYHAKISCAALIFPCLAQDDWGLTEPKYGAYIRANSCDMALKYIRKLAKNEYTINRIRRRVI